jgi:RNA polymerase sigma factor (sigma-70 family)
MLTASVTQESEAITNVDRATKVFEENGDFIRGVIRFHVEKEAEVEDLFQDLFLFLISKPIPQEVQNVKGFLYRVISDMTKDAFRRIERYQTRIHRYAKRNVRIIENRPENVLVEVEETKRMFELIERRLPPPEALAVTLRYRDNCNTDEVAARMGVKPRSVIRYVSAGLNKLRCVLGESQGGNYDSR